MRLLYLLASIVLFTSCAENEKDRIAHLVNEWQGKEILFPEQSVFTVQGKDTVDFSFADAEYKVVTYVDSVGCTSCKLQLPRWKGFVSEVDSLMNGSVPFLFYLRTEDMKEFRYLTRRDNFTYPVCFDEMGDFNDLNHFPDEMAFQTFLLDKDNKVVALGNPIHNPNVKELYLQVLTGNKATQPEKVVTQVSVDTEVLDFGTFPYKEKQERKFVLTNTGSELLAIQDVTTACGCTRVEYDKQPVRPGKSAELKITYIADYAERFRKSITVYCNAEDSPLHLNVTGIAK